MGVDAASLQRLATGFHGQIVTPLDPDYELGRRVWNVMIDRRPAVILRPSHAA